jgi:hypothetical protein
MQKYKIGITALSLNLLGGFMALAVQHVDLSFESPVRIVYNFTELGSGTNVIVYRGYTGLYSPTASSADHDAIFDNFYFEFSPAAFNQP